MERRYFKNLDPILVGCTLAVVAYSLLMIYSASKGHTGMVRAARQGIWAVIGSICMVAVASIDYNAYPRIANRIYAATVILLTAVLFLGRNAKGAQRWIGFGAINIQPSELAKIGLIIALAAFLLARRNEIREFSVVIKSFGYIALPLALVVKQPDLGTALVLVAIWFVMLFLAGARPHHLAAFALAGALLFTVMWHTGLVKDYQKHRLATFIDPGADPKDSGYHIRQSKIAIGSGRFLGKGYLHGTQSQLSFIPEQHTDFIFTVVGEEMGFAGGVVLLLLYFGLLHRAAAIMVTSEDPVGRLIAGGIVSMFLFQIFVNLGMTMGIMPVTGIPLPMFSYGGSSLLVTLSSIGILCGIYTRRHKINF
jgi:rod shape determining protein RodA